MQRQNALSDLEGQSSRGSGLVIQLPHMFGAMFTASEIDLAPNCKLAPAAPNRRRPFGRGISPSHHISRLHHLFPSKEQRFTVRPFPQHLLQVFASWVAGGIFRQINDLDLVHTGLARTCMTLS
jgi:hypothetical protein